MLRRNEHLPVFLLCSFSIAARVGFISSVFILLMARFNVSPIMSAITSVAIQGSITMIERISSFGFRFLSIKSSQLLGAALGAIAGSALLFIHNFTIFILVVFIASFSKVAIESTFPRVTHHFFNLDKQFGSKLVGVQQGSVLCVSAIIAPIALSGHVVLPMMIAVGLFVSAGILVYNVKECSDDLFEETIENDSVQQKFDRRFGDIVNNENIRQHQSRIHKFRRIPSTLLSIDLAVNIIGSGSAVLLPLMLKEINNTSQGMEPAFNFVFGTFAAITGLILFPYIRRKVNMAERSEWILLAGLLPLSLTSSLLWSTYLGIYVAIFSAMLYGLTITAMLGLFHQIAARNLTKLQYQQFGCMQMQRNAIARVLFPLILGGIANITSLAVAFLFLAVLIVVFVLCNAARVILVVNGRKFDQRTHEYLRSPNCPVKQLYPDKQKGTKVDRFNKATAAKQYN